MSFFTRAVDTALDVTIVPGYTRLGSTVRRHFWSADPEPFPSPLDVVVTGAGSGLGAAATRGLVRLGARVHLVGRTESTLTATAESIRARVPGAELVIRTCDMSDLDSVAVLTTSLLAEVPALHAIVHCAGVMPPTRTETAQGHESAFATHILGPVALTVGVRTLFDQSSRVIFVSSGGMYAVPMTTTDLEYTHGRFSGMTAYARTKRMQVVVAEQLAQAFSEPNDPVVHSMHPGWADTPGITDSMPGFGKAIGRLLRSADEGADTIVWLTAADEALAESGSFWHDRRPRPTHYPPWRSDSAEARAHLWETIVADTGIDI